MLLHVWASESKENHNGVSTAITWSEIVLCKTKRSASNQLEMLHTFFYLIACKSCVALTNGHWSGQDEKSSSKQMCHRCTVNCHVPPPHTSLVQFEKGFLLQYVCVCVLGRCFIHTPAMLAFDICAKPWIPCDGRFVCGELDMYHNAFTCSVCTCFTFRYWSTVKTMQALAKRRMDGKISYPDILSHSHKTFRSWPFQVSHWILVECFCALHSQIESEKGN